MKIAILTFPLKTNYGGILQAYALQKYLKDFGHEVYLVDIPGKTDSFLKYIINHLKVIYVYKNLTAYFKIEKQHEKIRKKIKNFIEENFLFTEPIDIAEIKEKLKKYSFDIYIVGSDQVWRPFFSVDIKTFFLDFVKDDKNIVKAAYSVSFGTIQWEFSKELTEECSKLIQNFDYISVRESSAVKLCQDYFSVKPEHLLDPTMIIDKNIYAEFAQKTTIKKENLITAYILDNSSEKIKIINKIADKMNMSVIELMPSTKRFKEKSYKTELSILPSIEEWLSSIMNAKFVVTDSFHGVVFSIIFNRQFIAINNKSRGSARFDSILALFNLKDRLINSESELTESLIKSEIDFDQVNIILKKEKEKASGFLQKVLEQKK